MVYRLQALKIVFRKYCTYFFSYKVSNLTCFFLAGSPSLPLLNFFVKEKKNLLLVKVLLAGWLRPLFQICDVLFFLSTFSSGCPPPLKNDASCRTVHYLKGIKWYEAVSLFILLNYVLFYVHLKGACWRILLNN